MANAFISFSRQFYYAGDTVQAVVYMILFDNILGSNQIHVKIKGVQTIKLLHDQSLTPQMKAKIPPNQISNSKPKLNMSSSDSDDNNTKMPENHYYNQNNNVKNKTLANYRHIIINAKQVLFRFDNNFIPAGQYAFPITFKTGDKYPATYLQKSEQKNRKGRIRYDLQVFIKSMNNSKIFRNKKQFVIRQTVPLKNNKEQVSIHVKSCGCLDGGTTKIQSYFMKNGYLPGQSALMNCIIDNTGGKQQVKSLNLTFINEIKYKGQSNIQTSITQTIFKKSLPGVKAGIKIQNQHQIKLDNSQLGQKYTIPSTTGAQRISSKFYLCIQPKIQGKQQSSMIRLPIVIYPNIKVDNFFRSPPNWNPKIFSVTNISLVLKQLIANDPSLSQSQTFSGLGVTFGGFGKLSKNQQEFKTSQNFYTPPPRKYNKEVQYIPISNSQIQHTSPQLNRNQSSNYQTPQVTIEFRNQSSINERMSFGNEGNINFGSNGIGRNDSKINPINRRL